MLTRGDPEADIAVESLAEGHIAIWFQRVPLPESGIRPLPPNCLDADERGRWSRFRFPADRALFGAAHALLRTALSRYAAIAAEDWRFHAPPGHRPELVGAGAETGLRFSLTHTRGLCACAVARGLAPGLDTENRERTFASELLTPQFFHPTELAQIENLPPDRRAAGLFDLWTLKEAYVKARGLGLALPFDRFIAHLRPPSYQPDPDAPRSTPWHAHLFSVADHHSLALAAQYPGSLTITLQEAAPYPAPYPGCLFRSIQTTDGDSHDTCDHRRNGTGSNA